MANSRYQYGTSPRKVSPAPSKRTKVDSRKKQIKIVEELQRKPIKISPEQRRKQAKMTMLIIMAFLVLLTISCRNSLIDKEFSQLQEKKKELATIQKENEQLKISIENMMNLSNIEKVAKEELGMQKISGTQTVYISLPKKDYIASPSDKVKIEEDNNFWENLLNKLLGF